jgi:hypothetical protein
VPSGRQRFFGSYLVQALGDVVQALGKRLPQ